MYSIPSDVPVWVWVFVGIAGLVQIGLLAWAFVKLVRTDPARLTLPFVAWILIILLCNILGPLAFLVFGVKPAPVDVAPTGKPDDVQEAVNRLYE